MTIITFIGAGSTVFTKNIAGDILHRKALRGATIRLMDIDPKRLEESAVVVGKLAKSLGGKASVETFTDQRRALDGADFVVVSFQIGGYQPATVTDFEVPKRFGLRQTIADTLGVGGIMRGLRTVPHLWSICADMMEVAPSAVMLQYVNPMAINTWAIGAKYPHIRQVGLCHSVQGTAWELARDPRHPRRGDPLPRGRHQPHELLPRLRAPPADGVLRGPLPGLQRRATRRGASPSPPLERALPQQVRYEMLMRLGYFVTESSEHFAEYVPWFIKRDRPDLLERFGIPLDEYPKRCVEQIARWDKQAQSSAMPRRSAWSPRTSTRRPSSTRWSRASRP
jgi:alpha-galactosidase